jgi:hypothetical protein
MSDTTMAKEEAAAAVAKEGAAAAATMAKEVAAAAATGATATGYRVSLVPGGLEVSARLASNEELAILVKVLEANKGSLGKSSD